MANFLKVATLIALVVSPTVMSKTTYSRRQAESLTDAAEETAAEASEYEESAPRQYGGSYKPSHDSEAGRGYLQDAYAPKAVVLHDDPSIDAKFPYPKFVRPYFPFEGSFDYTRHRRAAEDAPAADASAQEPVYEDSESRQYNQSPYNKPSYNSPSYNSPSYNSPSYNSPSYKPTYEAYPAVSGDEIAYGASTGEKGAFNWYADYPVRNEYKKY